MKSPIAILHTPPELSSGSSAWVRVEFCRQLGKFHQSLSLAYSLVQNDSSQQQRYQQHYVESMKLGAEFAEEIGDHHRAAHYWEQLTQQMPNHFHAWHGLGLAKANLQDFRGAEVALSRALQLEPTHPKVRSQLSEVQQMRQG
jgi:Tfp pilus assembly protein PilF